MLTKTDLNQIRGVVREEVDLAVEDKLKPIRKDLGGIGNIIDEKLEPIKKDLTDLKKDVKYLKKKVNRIDTTLNLVVGNYDEADVKLQRRVKKIEDHIGLTS